MYRARRLKIAFLMILGACHICGAAPIQHQNELVVNTNAAAGWLMRSARNVRPSDFVLLEGAQGTLLGNVVYSDAWRSLPGIVPSLGTYKGVWNWDAAFHAMAVSHWGPQLVRDKLRILFQRQLPDGGLPDVIYENGTDVTSITKLPVMAWAVAVIDHRHPNIAFLKEMCPKLIKLGNYLYRYHGGSTDGLYYYTGSDIGEESGWDNSIR